MSILDYNVLMKVQGYKSLDQGDYWNLHAWIRRNYGSAKFCENKCGTTAKVFDWALIHGKKYERKIENYKMLCKKCHHDYDKISRFGSMHPMFGKKHTDETRAKMRASSKHLKPNLGMIMSKQTREKISKNLKGKKFTQDHKNKISESIKKYHVNKKLAVDNTPCV